MTEPDPPLSTASYREILSDLPPHQAPTLLHLLTCFWCGARTIATLVEEQGIARLLSRPESPVPHALPKGNARVESALAELLSHPEEQHLELIEQGRFRSATLLERLLQLSRERQVDDPALSEHLAMLSCRLAESLHGGRDEQAILRVLFRAAILIGNARRLAGRLPETDRVFDDTELDELPAPERASFFRLLGLVRWEQGHFEEAGRYLDDAACAFCEADLLAEEGATHVLLGLLYAEQGSSWDAAVMLLAGLTALDPEERPWLAARGLLTLALVQAERGQPEASSLLEAARRLYPQVSLPAERVHLVWLEGRVTALLGNPQAEQLLESVRRKLIAEQRFAEAVLATIDLALALAGGGQTHRIVTLADETEESLAGAQGLEEALALLRGDWTEEADSLRERVRAATGALRKQLRLQGGGLLPLPFA